MGRIRAFVQEDIPTVAALYWRFLQGQENPHPSDLEKYLQEVFFDNPWFDSSMASLVYEEERCGVVGFLGVVPRPMFINGRPIQAAFGSSLVVHPESRWTLAGLQLLAAFMDGKQDLAMTDTASRLSQQIWLELGGSTSAAYSLQWARPLRPSSYALYVMSRFGKKGFSGACGKACQVLSKTMGAVATRIPLWRLRRFPDGITEEELGIDTLLQCVGDSSAFYSLRPQYSRESLRWLLDFMARMKAYGNLRGVALRDEKGQLIGWFIYYVRLGGIAEVAQFGAAKDRIKTVLNYLSCDAANRGAIALHGKLEVRHAQELSESRCFFWGTIPLLFRARNPELARSVQQGDAFLSRLDGEWCLRYGRIGAAQKFTIEEKPSPEATKRLATGNLQLSQPVQAKAVK